MLKEYVQRIAGKEKTVRVMAEDTNIFDLLPVFMDLGSFRYLYLPRVHEEVAGGGNKHQGYNGNLIFYMHGVVSIPYYLDFVKGKREFDFR